MARLLGQVLFDAGVLSGEEFRFVEAGVRSDFFEYWRFVLEDGNWVLDEICQKEEVDNGRKLC